MLVVEAVEVVVVVLEKEGQVGLEENQCCLIERAKCESDKI